MNWRCGLIPFLIFCSFRISAQINVSAALDSSSILIGDQVKLHVYVDHNADIKVQGVDYSGLENLANVEILHTSSWDTLNKGDQYVIQQHLTLTSFDSGYYQIPPLPVQYIDASGVLVSKNTNDLGLMVNTIFMPGDSIQLAPIKPIIEEPLKFQDFLPYLGGAAGLAVIGFLVYYFFFRPKPEGVLAPKPEVVRPPHEVALEKLAVLKAAKLWQQGEVKEYHSELTYVIREYIEGRFKVPALESTTSEIMRSLRGTDLEEDLFNRLRELLQMADLVKFAKAKPAAEIHDQAMQEVNE